MGHHQFAAPLEREDMNRPTRYRMKSTSTNRTGRGTETGRSMPQSFVVVLLLLLTSLAIHHLISSHFFAFDLINQTRPLRRPGVSS